MQPTPQQDLPPHPLLRAHLDALTRHQALLEQQHLNGNQHLDEINQSFHAIAITLAAYLKQIGLS